MKGIALVGAISVLEERGCTFHRVAGTSAGAIVGALAAAGMPATAMQEVMATLDYRRFRDGGRLTRFGRPGQLLALALRSGIYDGEYLRGWLTDQLEGCGVATFADLRGKDPNTSLPRREDFCLVVMASDITQGALRRLPWDYDRYGMDADAIPVADAVRASMSIPYFYRPLKVHDRVTDERCWLVDGGMLSNFPVAVFDRRDGRAPRWPTFGIKLSDRTDTLHGTRFRIGGVLSMTRAMVGTMTSFHDRVHIEDASVVERTIFIDTMGVRATDFDIDRPTQQRLFDNGRRAAEKFLDGQDGRPGWDFDAYLERHRPQVPAPVVDVTDAAEVAEGIDLPRDAPRP